MRTTPKVKKKSTNLPPVARAFSPPYRGLSVRLFPFLLFLLFSLLTISCAAGPTPERVGFSYPEYGIKFNPRRHVVSRAMGAEIAAAHPEAFTLLFPRITSQVENEYKRLLFSAVKGDWDGSRTPLFDEISQSFYGIDVKYDFSLTEERFIPVPWPGVESKTGMLRVFHMTPIKGSDGTAQYTFAVIVKHFGNTFEICWRDPADVAPDQQKIDDFFYWTHGLAFSEPEKPRSSG
jgi:hypothetical protein